MNTRERIVPNGSYVGEVIHDAATLLGTAETLMREVYPPGSRLIAFTLRVSDDARITLLLSAQQGAHFCGFYAEAVGHHDGYVVLHYRRRGW